MNLNNSVGSTERCQGGFISPAIDDDSTGTDLEMSPELTSVDILDYTLTNHINFEVCFALGSIVECMFCVARVVLCAMSFVYDGVIKSIRATWHRPRWEPVKPHAHLILPYND